MSILGRFIKKNILEDLRNHPVVFLNGPRQAGKSTLVQELSKKELPAEYITFDSVTQMAAAANAPVEFLSARASPLIIDEAQLVPEIFRALKIVVDELRIHEKDKANGRFLLTGSANILALPKLSDALVGRMSVLTLYPFASAEVMEGHGNCLDRIFSSDFAHLKHKEQSLQEVISLATYPEISGKDDRICSQWFEGYLSTLLQRDVKMLADLEKISSLPTLLRALSARAGHLLNDAELARDVGLNSVTGKFYRSILQMMFLIFDVKPWFRNITKRLVKSPKGYIVDTLLLSHMLGYHLSDIRKIRPDLYGHLIENFVATELLKLLSFGSTKAELFHFRTSDGKEVDFVIQKANGSMAGIEVKSSDFVDAADFQGLKELEAHVKNDFVVGIVLYSGKEVVPFGKKLWAVPFQILWQ